MKGVTIIGLASGDQIHVCTNCWVGGGRRLHNKTTEEIERLGLKSATTVLPEGPLTHCDVCKDKRNLN